MAHSEIPRERGDENFNNELTDMFGFVTPEDKARWAQIHASRKPKVNSFKAGLKLGLGSMMEFGQTIMEQRMDAIIKTQRQAEFEEAYDKRVTKQIDPLTGETTTSVNYARNEREPDLERF